MKTAGAYIRVSTEMQVEYSPDSQLRLIRDYAKTQGYIIPEEYIFMELGVSGKRADKRPEFQKMIYIAKQKQFEAILIYHTNRFARNHEESIIYKSMLKRDCDIDVISITQPPVDKKTDMLTNAIYSVMDEWYSIDLAENVKRGMTEKAMKGGYQCSPPYGYKIPGYKQAPITIEEEAKVVRLVFDLYLNTTTSTWWIGRKLTEMGYKTRRGNPWERRTIEYMIRNPAYKGMAVWNKRNNNKSINDVSEWIIVEGTHEAIISPEVFDKAQAMYEKNKTPSKARPIGTYKHWLTGVFKCSNCGRGLTYNKTKYGYFSCNGYKKGVCVTSNCISQLKAEKAVMDMIEQIAGNTYVIELDKIVCSRDNAGEIYVLENSLIKLDKKLERFKQAFAAGYDTLEEYGSNKKTVNDEKFRIQAEIKKLKDTEVDKVIVEEIFKNAKDVWESLSKNDLSQEEKSELIKSVINNIVFDNKKSTFEVFFNF